MAEGSIAGRRDSKADAPLHIFGAICDSFPRVLFRAMRKGVDMAVSELIDRARQSIETVVVGKRNAIDLMLAALLCRGHVLIEDVPGVGKTTLVSTMARTLGCSFQRIQFTPDVMPSDITGFTVADFKTGAFEFKSGAIMSQIILADEINRTSPKTQSSLLEAMQEGQVTVDGQTYALPKPFMVLATQNPIEYVGTFPLPEAQLDRFLLRINMGYPSLQQEVEIMTRSRDNKTAESVRPVISPEQVLELQEACDAVAVSEPVKQYIAHLIARTRDNSEILLGASPRASIALLRAASGWALIDKRDYVLPDDVQKMLLPVLAHRLVLKPEARLKEMTPERILKNIQNAVKVPSAV